MGMHRLSLRIRKPNPASPISFSSQAITLLALFLKKTIPTWLLKPVCIRICVLTLKTGVSSFLRPLPCNSAISIRFSRKTLGSKSLISQTFDWTICPHKKTRARGASVPDGNADRAQPLFSLEVAIRPMPTCTLAWPAGMQARPSQPQLLLPRRFRHTETCWMGHPYCSGGSMEDVRGMERMVQNSLFMKTQTGVIHQEA